MIRLHNHVSDNSGSCSPFHILSLSVFKIGSKYIQTCEYCHVVKTLLEHSFRYFPLCKPYISREQCTLWRHLVCNYVLGVLTIIMKTNTLTVVTKQRASPGSRIEEKNLKNSRENSSVRNLIRGFSPNLFCFHRNFCLRNGTELGNDLNYR